MDKIIATGGYRPYWVDDMKTPSGRIHAGALRGVILHDLIFKVLTERGEKATYTWVFNDMDPMDGFPEYLDESFRKEMGKPLFRIPSPEKGYKSLAECYAKQFMEVFNSLGVKPIILWSSEMYGAGRFNEIIREALDNVEKIGNLYASVSGYKKPRNWYPFQPICPKCGKIGTTIVTDWDGGLVTFECKKDLVKWAKGCGYKGKISPFNGTGKLMWKVDWAAHWKVIGITIEGAGKDHMAATGSHDLSSAISEKAFGYRTPYAFMYEWFLAKGGVKMSSSKGVGISAKEVSETLPPELLRFLMARVPYQRAIIFDPNDNDIILDLFDEYDKFAAVYYTEGNKNDMGRIWGLSQVGKIPDKNIFRPRFRDVANYTQMYSVNLVEKFGEIKGSGLNNEEMKELDKRIKYAKIWLTKYAPERGKTGQLAGKVEVSLNEEQKKYLKLITKLLEKDWKDPEDLQKTLYQTAKNNGIQTKNAFAAIYLALTGKTSGPKAAWFLLGQDKEAVAERFRIKSRK